MCACAQGSRGQVVGLSEGFVSLFVLLGCLSEAGVLRYSFCLKREALMKKLAVLYCAGERHHSNTYEKLVSKTAG